MLFRSRMDPEAALSAREVVNGYSEQSLYEILRDYGEEKFAKKIAFNLVKERERAPVETAGRLVEIVEKSIPAKFKQNGPCARKTFQAIRIEVNGELDKLSETVKGLARKLKKGGSICIRHHKYHIPASFPDTDKILLNCSGMLHDTLTYARLWS